MFLVNEYLVLIFIYYFSHPNFLETVIYIYISLNNSRISNSNSNSNSNSRISNSNNSFNYVNIVNS